LCAPFCSAYGEVKVGVALALVGSSNFVEVSIHQGNAAEMFGAKVGDPFVVSVDK
jgi:S-adenosylmethionine hydrolase